jgi:diguanylate cyclase (GGDEF)-like protein
MDVKKNIIWLGVVWLLVVALSFAWNYFGGSREQANQALLTARSIFQQVLVTRQWNVNHGGIYAMIGLDTKIDSYPEDAGKDIVVDKDRRMAMINPATMTRQISDIAEESSGIKFRITSLKPRKAANRASQREATYLRKFEQGLAEGGEFYRENGSRYYFYMAPLVTSKDCLSCHAEQGYREGDIRGGISVMVPFEYRLPLMILVTSHLIIGFLGLIGLGLVGRKLDSSFNTIKHQAVMDALTGIPNWRSFSESINREFSRSRRDKRPLSVIMCDIDNFKAYNDLYGHSAGDDCLINVARGVKGSLRRPGDFCARYGGEEFVVILSNTGLLGAMQVAEQIRSVIQDMRIKHSNSPPALVVTVSLGVATLNDDSITSYKELVKHADAALYRAKKSGKNQTQSYRTESHHRRSWPAEGES